MADQGSADSGAAPERKGGRRKNDPPLKRIKLCLTERQHKLLRLWGGGSTSAGLRWLIDNASRLIHFQAVRREFKRRKPAKKKVGDATPPVTPPLPPPPSPGG